MRREKRKKRKKKKERANTPDCDVGWGILKEKGEAEEEERSVEFLVWWVERVQ